MKSHAFATVLGLAALLSACGQQAETDEATATSAATEAGSMGETAGDMPEDMGKMATPTGSASKTAEGTGTVTAIDKPAGTITLDHGPIAEVNWPAMTMAFKAKPELLDSVKVGDKVAFDLALEDDGGEITAIRKQ